ncbi:MAG: HEXXH motif-containing putative peptide modification protein [Pseudobdellovibrionaceae bacterium]|nr:HEXXH motif-containing putative peptide modification protein [Pseudobdellovibrionaceae bacterium]
MTPAMTQQKSCKWIAHGAGARKIAYLSTLYFSKVTNEASIFYRRRIPFYYPWMSSYQEIPTWPSDLENLLDFQRDLFPVDQTYLTCLKDLFEKYDIPILHLKNEPQKLFVYPQAIRQHPNYLALYSEGWGLMCKANPWMANIAKKLVKQVIPVTRDGKRAGSSSSILSIGYLYMGLPHGEAWKHPIDLAIGFAHEIGHHSLMIYQNCDRILTSEFHDMAYSGVRKTQRPVLMVFHAAVALTFMLECAKGLQTCFASDTRERSYVESLTLQKRRDLELTLKGLERFEFTELGRSIMEDMHSVVEEA